MIHDFTTGELGSALVRQIFQRKAVIVVPECYWTGYECDLLCVAENLKIIDIELKMSRADFRADAGKAKWWRRGSSLIDYQSPRNSDGLYPRILAPDVPRDWPPRVWKHYFCMPAQIWRDEMLAELPSQNCGVLVAERGHLGNVALRVIKRVRANPDARPIDSRALYDLARLAGLRMWDALGKTKETDRNGND